ncbi:MAG: pilus assembly protein [Dehalococcoidia bacterium]
MTTLEATSAPSKPRSPWRRWLTPWRRDEGQAAFEFLLMLPLFFLFVLLMVDLGVMMYQYVSISNAAREGARYAAVNCDGNCTASEVQNRVVDRSGGILGAGDVGEVTVSWPSGTDRGDPVAVRIEHPYDFLFFPATIPVVSCSDMRLEQQDQDATAGGSGC